MFRRLVCAIFVVAIGVGVTLAAEINAVITKVDGDKVTFAERKGKDEKGPSQTLPVTDNVKVVKGKKNKDTKKVEAGDAIEGGLKNKLFSTISDKGIGATIVTDGDGKKITEIRVTGGGKKAKDK